MTDLLNALFHAVVYAVVSGAILIVAYYVLDLVTPGHLGSHLHGSDEDGKASVHLQSRSAALVASAWMISERAGPLHRDLEQRRHQLRLAAACGRSPSACLASPSTPPCSS